MGAFLARRFPLWGHFWPGACRYGGSFGQASYICGSCPIFFFNLCVRWAIISAKHMGVVHHVHHPLHHHGDACHAIHHGRACEVTSLFKQRSFRNVFSGFEVFMLNPISVWHAWCLIVTSLYLMPCLVIIVNVTGASRCGGHFCPGACRYGGHLCHPGSFAQTSGALGAYCEILIKDSCSHQA